MKTRTAAAALVLGAFALAGCSAQADSDSTVAPEAGAAATSEFSQELHDQLPAAVRDSGVITVAGDSNPPWRIPVDAETFEGFQNDLLVEFAAILGVDFEQVRADDVASAKLGVESGRWDVAFGPLLSSDATREQLLFIDYTVGKPSFLSAGDPAESYEDLCEATISYPDGTAVFDMVFGRIDEVCAAAGLEAPERLATSDNDAVILALRSGRADFGGMSVHQAAFAQSQNPDEFEFYVASDEEATPDMLGMGLAPGEVALAEALQGAWQVVFDNGVYEELMTRYNMDSITLSEPVLHTVAAR